MAPVNPGAAISWSRRPQFTDSLLEILASSPRPDAHLLLSIHLAPLTKAQRTRRTDLVKDVTARLFSTAGAGGREAEEKRSKSHQTSVGRRLQTIAKDYDTAYQHLLTLQHFAQVEQELTYRDTITGWNRLRLLLHDHPQHGNAQPNLPAVAPPPPPAIAPPPIAAPAPVQRRSPPRNPHPDDDYFGSEDDEDYMAGVEYAERHLPPQFRPRAQPVPRPRPRAPQVQQQPQQPVAGPAYPAPPPPQLGARVRPLPRPRGQQVLQQPVAGPAYPHANPAPAPPPVPAFPPPGPRPPRDEAAARLDEQRRQAEYDNLVDEYLRGQHRRQIEVRHPPQAPALAPAPAPQLQPQYHQPQPQYHQPQPQYYPHPHPHPQPPPPPQDDQLELCPSCHTALPLSPSEAAQHLQQCLDEVNGGLAVCPVCEMDLGGLGGRQQREDHVDACCRGEGQGGGAKERERAREWAEFQPDEKSLPRDPTTGEGAECHVCFEDFTLSDLLVRLSCYCVFHKGCMEKWWENPNVFCPVHRDDRISGTDYDVEMR